MSGGAASRGAPIAALVLVAGIATAHAQPADAPPDTDDGPDAPDGELDSEWNVDEPLDPETERGLDQLMLELLPATDEAREGERLPDLVEDAAPGELDAAPSVTPSAAPSAARGPVPFWGDERFFVSGILDLGFLFLRPRFYFGYGVPHRTWVGLEVNPIISGSGLGAYAGIRGEIPYGDLRVGGRYRYAWTRSFLTPLDGYDHLQVRDRSGPNASYLSLEAQLSFDIPIESTAIVGEITATYVFPFEGADGEFFLYEDTLSVILDPNFVWGIGLGYRIAFGDDDAFQIEPGFELVHLVEREDVVVRIGLRAAVTLFPDLQLRLTALPAIVSPDAIGAAGGDTFLLGIRFRWATDAPRFGDDG